jgi:hypothetical protein
MSEPAEIYYGSNDWYVKLVKQEVSDRGENYVKADKVEVQGGVLLFIQNQEEGEKIIMAFAPGTWLSVHITTRQKQ